MPYQVVAHVMAKLRGGLNILFYTPVLVFFPFSTRRDASSKLRVIPCQLEDFKGHPDDQDIDRKDADDPGDGNQNAELCELFRKRPVSGKPSWL